MCFSTSKFNLLAWDLLDFSFNIRWSVVSYLFWRGCLVLWQQISLWEGPTIPIQLHFPQLNNNNKCAVLLCKMSTEAVQESFKNKFGKIFETFFHINQLLSLAASTFLVQSSHNDVRWYLEHLILYQICWPYVSELAILLS